MPIFLERDAAGGPGGGRLLPPGAIMWTTDSVAPNGYLIRDGSSVPVATYPSLFAVIGYTYGGAGANFNLPDDRGLLVAGSGLGMALPGLTNRVLGSALGSETHTLTVAELATHTHLQNAHTHTQDSHTHTDSFTVVQDAHNHTQNAHTHTQNSHNHTQDPHAHTYNEVQAGGALATGAVFSSLPSLTNNATATNQAATATNQNATATNQATTATNQLTNITTDGTVATNQNTTAVNQNEGSSTPFSIVPPTRFYTPCIAY